MKGIGKNVIYILILFAILSFFIVGYILFPSLFYDQFIWKYFWGPIVSDVKGYTVYYHGIPAADKYTLVSEIIYGVIVITVLFLLYRLLTRWNIVVDWRFWSAILPFVFIGSVTRVLEDSNFLREPYGYWFVAPIIYINILLWTLLFFLLGFYLHKHFPKITINRFMGTGGWILSIPFIWFIVQWMFGYKWNSSLGSRIDVLMLVLTMVSSILIVIFVISKVLSKKFKDNKFITPFREPLNLSMIGGHLIDGLTSYISIYDPFNMGLPSYSELHPASNLLMNIWPPLFPIVKFILIVAIILLLDVVYAENSERYRNLINLLKIGIFILGFAPGTRDLLRVTMGV